MLFRSVHGHFQGEDGHGHVVADGGAHAHVQGQGRLAHGRAGGQDDEVRLLQAGRHVVEVRVARGHAGDQLALSGARLELLEDALDQVLAAHEGRLALGLGDGEDLLLGLVQEGFGLLAGLEAAGQDLRRRLDEAAAHGLVPHDLGVVDGVGGRGHGLGQGGQVDRAADLVELPPGLEVLGHGNQVHGLAAAVELLEGLVDDAVDRGIEVLVGDDVDKGVKDVVAQKNPAQHRLFGFGVVRGDSAQQIRRGLLQGLFRLEFRSEALPELILRRLLRLHRSPARLRSPARSVRA